MIDHSSVSVAPLNKSWDQIFVAAVLCITVSSAASLASTHHTPVALPPSPIHDNQQCLRMQPSVHWGTISPLLVIGNH